MKRRLSHVDAKGRARMVNVEAKALTARRALAEGRITMSLAAFELVRANRAAKGDVLAVAELAGVAGAKRTAELIPLCHPLPLASIEVALSCDPARNAVDITATCRTTGKTGVEMEALTAVSVAALTVYDMCKAVDRSMVLTDIKLEHKSGGKSGTFDRQD